MSSTPLPFRLAQAVGFTGAAWLSGNIAALSTNATPALLDSRLGNDISPGTLAKQWRRMFEAGKTQNPPIAAVTSSAFLYLAWCVRAGSPMVVGAVPRHSALYCSAAALTLGIVPYTIIAMGKTNGKLLEKSELDPRVTEKAGAEIDELVRSWISLNGFRSLLPLAGGFFGILAALT
ncbi:hypothetical protein N7522_003015 [Penicillium canescens]|nr:hypothetical protein N7522_003015 [Penicillium canescens]